MAGQFLHGPNLLLRIARPMALIHSMAMWIIANDSTVSIAPDELLADVIGYTTNLVATSKRDVGS
jgi:hypothetical protein